ncbi:MAG: hypothetical protein AB1798_19230, partial [Spirochaetota bacterium]
MRSIPLAVLSTFMLLCPASALCDQSATFKDTAKYYVTEGNLNLPIPIDLLSDIVGDFNSYQKWALKGLDGSDPVSKEFIFLFKDIQFIPSTGFFEFFYNVNLPWPFASSGNIIRFQVQNNQYDPQTKERVIRLMMNDTSLFVKDVSINFELKNNSGHSSIDYSFKVKFTWI